MEYKTHWSFHYTIILSSHCNVDGKFLLLSTGDGKIERKEIENKCIELFAPNKTKLNLLKTHHKSGYICCCPFIESYCWFMATVYYFVSVLNFRQNDAANFSFLFYWSKKKKKLDFELNIWGQTKMKLWFMWIWWKLNEFWYDFNEDTWSSYRFRTLLSVQ